jgi:pyruvate dehydrogenase E2 component (dihydrolipoamide acetyltransferase)
MAEVIKMPRLSDTMTEGVIAAWHKKVGDVVKKGDVLAEIETDKATMELESYQNGVLLHIGTGDGGKLQVDDLLAILGTAGENISSYLDSKTTDTVSGGQLPKQIVESSKEPEEKPTDKIEAQNFEEAVLMPRLSDTMTEGVIAAWLKKVGEKVKKGDVIAEIETDKATMELESYKNGILLFQGAKAGEKIQVNDLLCIIGEEGLDINQILNSINKGGFEVSKEKEVVENNISPAVQDNSEIISVDANGRIFASPLAKKIAAEKGIDLQKLKGSGDHGRIVKEDVDNYKSTQNTNQPQVIENIDSKSLPKVGLQISGESFEEIPVSQMRKVIAKRLAESLYTAPHFYLTMIINMDASIEARVKINDGAKSKISFNDLVLKATALSLKLHPKINSSWLGDKIRINHHVNIGVAVAVEEGLLVPVVRYADTKSLSQINVEVKDFAQKAKDKKLQPSDWEGSTFTISNLGMFGIDQFTAIINPPDACILAVGGISQEPIVKNGILVVGNIMKVTLSCDHRVVDGATGAAFLQTLKGFLEEPIKMLV